MTVATVPIEPELLVRLPGQRELPGAQHVFDLFHSIRFETVVDGIEAFAARVA